MIGNKSCILIFGIFFGVVSSASWSQDKETILKYIYDLNDRLDQIVNETEELKKNLINKDNIIAQLEKNDQLKEEEINSLTYIIFDTVVLPFPISSRFLALQPVL